MTTFAGAHSLHTMYEIPRSSQHSRYPGMCSGETAQVEIPRHAPLLLLQPLGRSAPPPSGS